MDIPSGYTLHEYAHHHYEKIKKDQNEPRFWGEILASKEQILEIFIQLKATYQGNSYMENVVSRMESEVIENLKIIQLKYDNFKNSGRLEELHPKSHHFS